MRKDIDTYFGYTDDKRGFFSSNETKWITRINKLREQNPEDIRVIREPKDNDGTIYVELPASWLKIQPPKKSNITEEQRDALRKRMKEIRSLSSK